jgi:tetraacyldisaccharide-1-P 4'-kinase
MAFVRTLEEINVVVRHAYALDDHFSYTIASLKGIVQDARRRGLLYLVTTEKDEVKLPSGLSEEIPVLVLRIEWTVTGGEAHWKTLLKGLELAGGRP